METTSASSSVGRPHVEQVAPVRVIESGRLSAAVVRPGRLSMLLVVGVSTTMVGAIESVMSPVFVR